MRTTILALAALCCFGAMPAARAQTAPSPQPAQAQPDLPPDAGEGDQGGAGYLPGAQFQRKLDGGPGFVCTATNALRTDQCTASCRKGETADCVDAEGSGAPSCSCTHG
ncbi:hypothetical protein [Lichenibacterium dinghuense]|uniref:hypothetical protein n=1 Tax=Lichenibacterium dinghuense TaxID=2895977 RepID=UPI001F3B81B1|nr:hypothetical protein [Lichenibacterium sp. 6Y81]